MLDIGASISILPPTYCNQGAISHTALHLLSVNGQPLKIYGEVTVHLSSSKLRRNYFSDFIVADITTPILGLDFLAKHNLIINCKEACVTDGDTGITMSCQPAQQVMPISLTLDNISAPINTLISKYPNIVKPLQFPIDTPKTIQHHIETTTERSIYFRPRQLPPNKLEAAKKEFAKMMEAGIIRPSNSDWASPLHMVEKPDKTWRPCGDYRALNSITVPDRYPIPHIHHIHEGLHNCKYFSKIDLLKAYYQISMNDNDIRKTAITTPFGLFEFLQMPFGLRNAA